MSWVKHPLAGLFLLIGGIAMLGGTIWIGVDTYRFVAGARSVPGTVVALHRGRGTRGSTRIHPIVEYRDPASGSMVRFQSGFGIWPSPFAIDDVVVVAIGRDLERVEINSFWSLWFLPLLLALFGAACIVASRSILMASRQR